jgi:hypothetical protein
VSTPVPRLLLVPRAGGRHRAHRPGGGRSATRLDGSLEIRP